MPFRNIGFLFSDMLFTVITINYNNAEGLRRTIESVANQTYTDYEYLIIDGGSTDGSVDVIRKYQEKIAYWVSEKDRGIYHAMNKGMEKVSGDYVVFMNSGDMFYSNTVLSDVSLLISNEDIVIGDVLASGTGEVMSPPPLRDISMYHLYSGAIPHQGAFVKSTLQKRHPFDETLKIAADWKFFLQTIIFENSSVKYIPVTVALYDTTGISSQNPKVMREEKERVLAECFPRRVLDDYRFMKESECLTQKITPMLRTNYSIDRFVYKLAVLLINIKNKFK